ncbi:uncharacterized protein LOC110906622 [Helianthus annuus]|uniref:uncharacterized protein LOC110906622 n=1 Tax=Helianthus annuus TaxID=4232 RepID=UPI000B8FCE5B|nr:uncharacterized protein LOC110906622 [Helianthus annuus]
MEWNWSANLVDNEVVSEFNLCSNMIQNVALSQREDSWKWLRDNTGSFTVKSVKKMITKGIPDDSNDKYNFKWCRWIPSKCNIFAWRLTLDRIPMKRALMKRNIHVGNMDCVLCGDWEENVENLFTGCRVSTGVWQGIPAWCKIRTVFAFTVSDLFDFQNICAASTTTRKEAIRGVFIITCWWIWRTRNQSLFKHKSFKVADIVANIKTTSFLWFKHRQNEVVVDWNDWCNFCFLM